MILSSFAFCGDSRHIFFCCCKDDEVVGQVRYQQMVESRLGICISSWGACSGLVLSVECPSNEIEVCQLMSWPIQTFSNIFISWKIMHIYEIGVVNSYVHHVIEEAQGPTSSFSSTPHFVVYFGQRIHCSFSRIIIYYDFWFASFFIYAVVILHRWNKSNDYFFLFWMKRRWCLAKTGRNLTWVPYS